VGESGVLEHKSGNISETRKNRGKVTMDGPFPTPYAPLSLDWRFEIPPKI